MAYAMYRCCVFSMHSGELAYKADGHWMSSTCSIVSYYVHSQSIAVPCMSITCINVRVDQFGQVFSVYSAFCVFKG
jgi:hypothetical protein